MSDDLELDDDDAACLAEPFKMGPGRQPAEDPCPNIPPALLSADHINEYAKKTGMIAPFDGRFFSKSPLKAASYESKIGKCAYIFDRGVNHPRKIYDGSQEYLEIPANSIVYVESETFFRLPPFIAVRFNLQINHVHRGLLLGTGPLVDPGFWGRLCIPLHNLTNQDYRIPKNDGLIWIEFTKTSSSPKMGRPPSNTDFANIKKFIEKAAKPQLPEDSPPIPIRSSIPDMVEEANAKSAEAAVAANQSAEYARKTRNFSIGGVILGVVAVLTLAATVFGLSLDYFFGNRAEIQQLAEVSENTAGQLDDHVTAVAAFGTEGVEGRASVPALRSQIESQDAVIEALQDDVETLKADVDRLRRRRR